MTNDTTPTENGAADAAAVLAAMTETTESPSDNTSEPEAAKPPSFDDLGLHPDVRLALDDMGYFAPTPVQTAVFKPVSEGKDLLVQSRTGTGKTTAFGLPIVNRMVPTHRAPQALILAPTRELALQVARELTMIGKHRGILIEAVYGGAPIGKQIQALREGVHIIVGTPGRVLDHIGRRTLDCRTISTFVLDECDEMLSMGFLEDIERVTSHLPEKHQTLLFSATMPDEVQRYARRHMTAPEQISLSRDSVSVADIHHAYYIVSGIARSRDLLKVIFAEEPESAIIFCNTRDETTMVAKFLKKQGLDAEPLSSDLSQSERERVMGRMKAKNLRFLCATDVAARGIDISDLSHVINYTVPESPEVYVHRTGRTGRAGKKGTAISLVGPRELGNFRYVRLQFGIKPEERMLPKDDIFEGRLKVPLPPVGAPQPPDPVQILMRGVQGTPSDLERQIFEKLLAKNEGKRVLAQLVAEKLDQLSTRSRPRRERRDANGEREERGERDERRFDDGDRHRGRDRDRDRGERRFDDGDRHRDRDRGERRFGEHGDRHRVRDRDRDRDRDRGERRDRRDREALRAEGNGEIRAHDTTEAREARDERPARDERHARGERRDREERFGRDRGERRDRDRDRGERRERRDTELTVAPESAAPAEHAEAATTADEARLTREERPAREERRDRRVRGERPERPARADRAAEPAEQPEREAAPAAAEPERAKKKDKRSSEVTEATREFWETWAETKTTKTASAAAADEAASEEPARTERKERGGRGRGRKEAAEKASDRKEATEKASDRKGKKDDERPSRAKRDTAVDAARPSKAAVASNGQQARLFVSLGKKHGVTADDLRSLLAGPIGGDTSQIGSVSLRDSHAHVRVPEEHADSIIAGVHGTLHNDHNVTVERARA